MVEARLRPNEQKRWDIKRGPAIIDHATKKLQSRATPTNMTLAEPVAAGDSGLRPAYIPQPAVRSARARSFGIDRMEHIAAAGNTGVPAYLALMQEGFRVERQTNGDIEEWIAERDDLQISGSSTVEVLGLYFMRKVRGPNWKAGDPEIDSFLKRFYPETKT